MKFNEMYQKRVMYLNQVFAVVEGVTRGLDEFEGKEEFIKILGEKSSTEALEFYQKHLGLEDLDYHPMIATVENQDFDRDKINEAIYAEFERMNVEPFAAVAENEFALRLVDAFITLLDLVEREIIKPEVYTDHCHRHYMVDSEELYEEMFKDSYDAIDFYQLPISYGTSCPLRFINLISETDSDKDANERFVSIMPQM